MATKTKKAGGRSSKTLTKNSSPIYTRIRKILEQAHISAVRSVNTAQVVSYWLIGNTIVEEEQHGRSKADYGKRLIEDLSKRLLADVGPGYSAQNLWLMRQFYTFLSSSYRNYKDSLHTA